MKSVFSFPSIYIHQHYERIGLKCNKEKCLCLQPLKCSKSPINQLLEQTWGIVCLPPMWGGTLLSSFHSCAFFLSWPPFSYSRNCKPYVFTVDCLDRIMYTRETKNERLRSNIYRSKVSLPWDRILAWLTMWLMWKKGKKSDCLVSVQKLYSDHEVHD